jgi:molybdopterin-containing oxidoreductase family iron-sulfur binding subunit
MLLCFDGFDFANLLVKTREVVPSKLTILITGARFSANARIQSYRCMTTAFETTKLGKDSTWTSVDAKLNQV